MRAALVLNERAGGLGGETTPLAIADAVLAAGIQLAGPTPRGWPLDVALAAAIAHRPDTVLVGGGDGTIGAAAALLANARIPLAVLPLGTLNHFARDLGLPDDWRAVLPGLAFPAIRTVDLAEVNGHGFVNNCSIGWYADAVRRRDALRRVTGGSKWPAMIVASFTAWRRLRSFRVRIEAPGRAVTVHTPMVVVANNRYAGHVLSSSLRPRLDAGCLWLYTTKTHRFSGVLRMVWQALTRGLDQADALDGRPATELTITPDRAGTPIATDGEVISVEPPFRFRIRPGALQVLVPGLRAA